MANNMKHPLEDPPSLSSSAAGEFLFISSQEEDEEDQQHTIFSSDEGEPEDPPPRSSSEALLFGRRISTNVRSKRARRMYTQGEKIGADHRRLFSEKDEIVLLQGVIDSKGENPLGDYRSLFESMKGSFSFDITLRQFSEKFRTMRRKYTTKEMRGEQASASNPHQQKCFQLSKAIWGVEGIAFESANGKSKESKKVDLVTPRKGKNNVQDGSKREDMKKSPHVVIKSDWDESSFFLGMDFLKEKWTKVPTETKKKTQEKMKKLHANELECQKYEEMLKDMKVKCEHDKPPPRHSQSSSKAPARERESQESTKAFTTHRIQKPNHSTMANNLKHPFEDPPSSPSSSAGEKEIEFVSSQEDEDEEGHQHTIFSSDEDEPEDPPPRSSGEAQLSGRKRLSEGISSSNVSSKRAKKGQKMGTKKRLFSEKDEIVLLQGIVDYKGKNPLEDKRSLYESMKGSFSSDVTLDQFRDKIRHMNNKYTAKEKSGEQQASILNPHQQKCFQLSKAIWGADGIAFQSANGKLKKSEGRVSKKRDLVSSLKGKKAQEASNYKRGDMKKSSLVEKGSDWDDESSFFLGMDFLKEKWTKLPTETKKGTQEKMKKLHANELECQKFEKMLKTMKDKCAHDKVELLNEVTSLIMAAD
ncbi:unnamed protein product [Brassica napus]|nr:unnamed protein product [Brassica napus]